MNKRPIVLAIVFMLTAKVFAAAPQLNGRAIMERNEDARRLSDVISNARLTSGGEGTQKRVKDFTWWRKLQEGTSLFNTLTRFKKPAEIKDEGILFLEREGNKNEILMYLPSFKKTRRVESQQQSSAFMGSQLSYSDMATPHAADYQHQLLRTESCGEGEENRGVTCYVVESIPVSDEVRERTGYSAVTAWIRSDNFMMVRSDYKNLKGELFKRMEATDIRVVDSANKKWMAHTLSVKNLKTGHFTSLSFEKVKANQGIQNSIFTIQNLERP
ncbi:MAG: outer membrane lipoprotein-sorting protein [Bdellovibrio sp.]|nr:outer membrane lipoprotein-sorting protein [Bdellovibrio sp.]